MASLPPIEALWKEREFTPNTFQEKAIRHVDGPLFLPAGPGSGKTRVLLWRTVNLIVYHDVDPKKIFLSTFTEKAAFQLKEGLRSLLADVTNKTGKPYDISQTYVGTVHSLCRRLITNRNLSPNRLRRVVPSLRDELGQYFLIHNRRNWEAFLKAAELVPDGNTTINQYLSGRNSMSRHMAVSNLISIFNRFSEECIEPVKIRKSVNDPVLQQVIDMYSAYISYLGANPQAPLTDFALLQQEAYKVLMSNPAARSYFEHVIIDEYQDTNTIQERLFFLLAEGHKNLCVVGDDDQALYRFRGATVENFVQFEDRCVQHFKVKPRKIELVINYRSRESIVDFYNEFIQQCDWSHESKKDTYYRINTKKIIPSRKDSAPAVIATTPTDPESAYAQIASLVKKLIETKKVENPNQIAFLFPALKYNGKPNQQVVRCMTALANEGLKVYAPRAGRFLEVTEAKETIGVFLNIFGKPANDRHYGGDYQEYQDYLSECLAIGKELIREDKRLGYFVSDCRAEIENAIADYEKLSSVVVNHRWSESLPYQPDLMKRTLYNASGLSERAKKSIANTNFERRVLWRLQTGNPYSIEYVIRRATALDWSVLDLFYRICGFQHFQRMFDLAQLPDELADEGPICNLSMISQYLSVFMDEYATILTANLLAGHGFQRIFFSSFLYALFRRGETEYEDVDDPFPKGRIPLITVHQAKGLEFPIVVLGSTYKMERLQKVEEIVNPLLKRDSEPIRRIPKFDVMRIYYVALSRAKNLLIIPHFQGNHSRMNREFHAMLDHEFPRIPDFDIETVPPPKEDNSDKVKNYSYTGDYLNYQRCPRQYMIFKKYDFVPSRTSTMVFGSLVHRTLEDLHEFLKAKREAA